MFLEKVLYILLDLFLETLYFIAIINFFLPYFLFLFLVCCYAIYLWYVVIFTC